jgi:hypothetical protein
LFTLTEKVLLLEFAVEELAGEVQLLDEASKLTPYQKAQQNRRRTIATHSPRPSKQSTFYKHAVRAIFQNLRKSGESFKGAARGGQLIGQWMLKKYGYASGNNTGGFSLSAKGHKRNKKHTSEPSSIRAKKAKAYDYIMGIQRKQQKRQQQVKHKAASAG